MIKLIISVIFKYLNPLITINYQAQAYNYSLLAIYFIKQRKFDGLNTAGNRHKQNSWFCKEIREDNFWFWWRRVHEDALQGMYMSKIEICLFTA
jgi:hypothetical protein